MRAALVDGKGTVALAEAPGPRLDEYDCLVRMEACAFCNSTDRHLVEGTMPFPVPYPSILGHESVGVIEKTGARVRNFAAGDRVLRPYAIYPEETVGSLGSAWGGFAEFGKVRDALAMAEDGRLPRGEIPHQHRYQQTVPPAIPPRLAPLLIPLKEILSCTRALGDVSGTRHLVLGAGIVGFLFALLLRRRGARVTLAARREAPLAFARRHGATEEALLLREPAPSPGSFDALVETTGSLDAAARLLPSVKPGGRIWMYAVYADGGEAALAPFKARHVATRLDPKESEAHQEACDLILRGDLDLSPLVSHEFPLREIGTAWRTVVDRATMKTLVHLAPPA